jgi:predicted nucleic acid-binding protein
LERRRCYDSPDEKASSSVSPKAADTSIFVSLYIPDQHTAYAEQLLASRPIFWMTPLHVAEWVHAVEQHVLRKLITPQQADKLIRLFEEHRRQRLWKEAAVPDRAFEVCAQLARRYAARLGVRTLDTLHVASALELQAEHFWTLDQRQAKLVAACGLRTASLPRS